LNHQLRIRSINLVDIQKIYHDSGEKKELLYCVSSKVDIKNYEKMKTVMFEEVTRTEKNYNSIKEFMSDERWRFH